MSFTEGEVGFKVFLLGCTWNIYLQPKSQIISKCLGNRTKQLQITLLLENCVAFTSSLPFQPPDHLRWWLNGQPMLRSDCDGDRPSRVTTACDGILKMHCPSTMMIMILEPYESYDINLFDVFLGLQTFAKHFLVSHTHTDWKPWMPSHASETWDADHW